MKIIRSIALTLVLATTMASASHYHSWSKDGEYESNGKTVCTWVCSGGGEGRHYATTSGYGYCSRP